MSLHLPDAWRLAVPALRARGLCLRFGALQATRQIDFDLPAGARHALIGPNGAGKTTFINLLTGVLAPDHGTIALYGEDITRRRPDERVKRGLVRTFQVTSLFPQLSVLESVTLAICEREGLTGRWHRRTGAYADVRDEAHALLQSLHLAGAADRPTHSLAYGQQRVLELALALALKPRVLLLDEPAAGIPTAESAELFDRLDTLPAEIAVLFIEHDMRLVFRFARRITVLAAGAILAEGTPEEIADHPKVQAVYLGQPRNRAQEGI